MVSCFSDWPAPGSEDTEFGVLMELEVGHGETKVYPGVQAWGGAPDQGSKRILCAGLARVKGVPVE